MTAAEAVPIIRHLTNAVTATLDAIDRTPSPADLEALREVLRKLTARLHLIVETGIN